MVVQLGKYDAGSIAPGNGYKDVPWKPSGIREIKAQKSGNVNKLDT